MSLELKKDEVRVLERFWDDGQYSRVLRIRTDSGMHVLLWFLPASWLATLVRR